MKTWAFLLCSIGVLQACAPSNTVDGPPNHIPAQASPFALTGVLLDEDEQPLAAATVSLSIELTDAEVFGGFWGTPCDGNTVQLRCNAHRTATTDPLGSFSIPLSPEDVQDESGNSRRLTLHAGTTGTLTAGFFVTHRAAALPLLHVWEAEPAVAVDGSNVRVKFPGFLAASTAVMVDFVDASQQLFWSQPLAMQDALDARVLEDRSGTLSLVATASPAWGEHAVDFTWVPPSQAFTGPAGAPPSRGRACFQAAAGGAVEASPCPLTDASLLTGFQAVTAKAGRDTMLANKWVGVDLGSIRKVGLVVWRGLHGAGHLQGSLEGVFWFPLDQYAGHEGTGSLALPANVYARFVRVDSHDATLDLASLLELSVW